MSPEPNREETLFAEALTLPASERAAFLERECAGDLRLRQSVEALLRAAEQAGEFLEQPPTGIASDTVLATTQMVHGTEQPGERIGRYKLLERIGEGGFGEVWMAEQEEPVRRRVALKIIKLGMDTKQVIARFEAERQALALMDHPHIAKVFDGGATSTGRPYFVMELVRGAPITAFCEQQRLSIPERLELFMQVCAAVQHAHQKGIIHRDLKPSNVLVSMQDDRPTPKVIDFGIAKATAQPLTEKTLFTRFGQLIGTPAYMSPEQTGANPEDIDTRSDIYSLGVLLYELLIGRTPFETRKLLEAGYDVIVRVIREEEPPSPSTRLTSLTKAELSEIAGRRKTAPEKLGKLVHGELDCIAMKCLEKDRARRYETASALAMDLQRYLRHEPVVAAPPSVAYRFERFVRRHWVGLSTASAFVAVLLGGIIVSTWQAWRANRFAQEAHKQRKVATNEAARAIKLSSESERTRQEAERAAYYANMSLIQIAWDEKDHLRLRQLLQETQNFSERGFEWYYWWKQTHRETRTFHLKGHQGTLTVATFSPDTLRIITGGRHEEHATVWDARNGRELFKLRGHSKEIRIAAISRDAQRIVTGSGDATAKVWDASGNELFTFGGHIAPVEAAAFSPDGERIVTGAMDRKAKVWSAVDGRELITYTGHTSSIIAAAFSPDGQRIATASFEIKIWGSATGQEMLTVPSSKMGTISLAFSPDGQRIVAGSLDASCEVIDAVRGQKLLKLQTKSGIWAVTFSPDGKRILTAQSDGTARVWDATSGLNLVSLQGHTSAVRAAGFYSDGERIMTVSSDHTAKVWAATNGWDSPVLRGHRGPVLALAFSPDSRWMVTASADHTAKIWEIASGRELFTLAGHTNRVWSAAFSRGGKRIVTGSADRALKIWDAGSGRELFTLTNTVANADSTAFFLDERWLPTGSRYLSVKDWVMGLGRELPRMRVSGFPQCVGFSSDGQRIVAGVDHTVIVWDAVKDRQLLSLDAHTDKVTSAAFSRDSKRLITGSHDQTARVWQVETGREEFQIKKKAGILSVAFTAGRPAHCDSFGEHSKNLGRRYWQRVTRAKGPWRSVFGRCLSRRPTDRRWQRRWNCHSVGGGFTRGSSGLAERKPMNKLALILLEFHSADPFHPPISHE